MDNDAFIKRIASLAQKWNEIEGWIKWGENINKDTITPAINELRYAGRKIVEAFESQQRGNEDETEEHIYVAENDINKARHDVVDAVFSFSAEQAGKLRDEVSKSNAQKNFPKYGELFGIIKNIAEKIDISREKREQRDEIYNELINELPHLRKLCDEFEVSVDAIQERMERELEKELEKEKKELEKELEKEKKELEKELEKEKKAKKFSFVLSLVGWAITIVIAVIYINSR